MGMKLYLRSPTTFIETSLALCHFLFCWSRLRRGLGGRLGLLHEGHVFATPVLERTQNWACGEVTQRAQASPVHLVGDVLDQLDVSSRGLLVPDRVHALFQPICSLAARRTFAAAFVLEEVDHFPRRPHHVYRLIQEDHGRRSQDRAD